MGEQPPGGLQNALHRPNRQSDFNIFNNDEKLAALDEEIKKKHKPVCFFGTDVGKIPCFRGTVFNGLGVGVLAGIMTFILTSKGQLSTYVFGGTFIGFGMIYWSTCRWSFSVNRFQIARVKEISRIQSMYQGTNLDPKVNPNVTAEDIMKQLEELQLEDDMDF